MLKKFYVLDDFLKAASHTIPIQIHKCKYVRMGVTSCFVSGAERAEPAKYPQKNIFVFESQMKAKSHLVDSKAVKFFKAVYQWSSNFSSRGPYVDIFGPPRAKAKGFL